MPRYDAQRIEPKWQQFWEASQTFRVEFDTSKEKLYVLDMFPYPSGDGLHVGHPEGYTATDIVCRFNRMRGKNVLHPMGWDAFGLPAEQHAIKTGTHPRVTTEKNINTFKRQLKMLGFSYDWSRELATTDPEYVRWTQWIFLQLFDTWYDPNYPWSGPDGERRIGKGRPIAELPIPAEVRSQGDLAVRKYQDANRLAYIHEAPVNWCPALGTVLANEEVTADGKSDRGNHPVERRRLKQWMLRITAYAERLIDELEPLNWSESIKALQRNWIGKSIGAEVDFLVQSQPEAHGFLTVGHDDWKNARAKSGFPNTPEPNVIRVYTTRPDTLFGVTYMVLAPEHPLVDTITTPAQRAAVDGYRQKAALKSDLDRTDLAKEKSGVFTGGYAINPVNGERVPVWIADYVLISYGTGAIMAVPAHDERDFEFAQQFGIEVKAVVMPPNAWLRDHVPDGMPVPEHDFSQFRNVYVRHIVQFDCFGDEGTGVNSGPYDGLPTAEFKTKITTDLASQGLGKQAVNYRLRDWLFSRQRYWGEPFPIWHELDASGEPTGMVRAVTEADLPVRLPEMEDFQPTGTPEPLLSKAPTDWLYATAADGTKLKRETNSMPQWAGSCWYYLRFCDNKNGERFIDPAKEKYWLPVDLYIGGAEHAVLHLLYARFWHKVLFDRGHLSYPEPFQRLVNQGMILGEVEYRRLSRIDRIKVPSSEISDEAKRDSIKQWSQWNPDAWELMPVEGDRLIARSVKADDRIVSNGIWVFKLATDINLYEDATTGHVVSFTREQFIPVPVPHGGISPLQGEGCATFEDGKQYLMRCVVDADVMKVGQGFVLRDKPEITVEARSYKMSKSRGNVINPDTVVKEYGADSLRLYEMFMGPLEATKPWSMAGVDGIFRFLGRVWRLVADDRADDIRLADAVQDVPPTLAQLRVLHKTIKAVTDDIDRLQFNTAISRMMEFTNEFTSHDVRPKSALSSFVLLLSPFAPHLAEELWQLLGHPNTLAYEPWPTYDPALLVEAEIEVPVQINGKVRGKVTVPKDADQATIEAAAHGVDAIAQQMSGKTVVKVVYVAGKLLNIVVK